MALNRNMALDDLACIVQVIGDDRGLREWFRAMAHESAVDRRNKIYAMVERMRADGEEADLVASFQLLADSRIFRAARVALREDCKDAA
jgi:hypothetical protein